MEKWWMRNVRERVGQVSDIKFFLALVACFCFAAMVPRLVQPSVLCSVRYSRDECIGHLGGRAQSCAWCPDALDGARCFTLLPCQNRTRPGCAVQWEGDGSVCAAADGGDDGGDDVAEDAAHPRVLLALTIVEHFADVFAPVMTMLGATFIVAHLTHGWRFHFYFCFVTFFGMLILFALWSQGLIPFSTNSPYSRHVTGSAAALFVALSPFVFDILAQGIGVFVSQRAFVRVVQFVAMLIELVFLHTAVQLRAPVQLVLVSGWYFTVNASLVGMARHAQTPLVLVALWALTVSSAACWWWYVVLVGVPEWGTLVCLLGATLPTMAARVVGGKRSEKRTTINVLQKTK